MARHLEETDIPIEYKGMKYNISPSALRSNNLTVELPEVKVSGKRKNKGYKSAFDPNGAGEFAGTMMNSPLQLADYAINRFIDTGKGEYGKTDYKYTPVQTTMQRVGETLSPTRWIGTLRSGFKESPWSENNPGLTGNPYLDLVMDFGIGGLGIKGAKHFNKINKNKPISVEKLTPEQWTAAQDKAIARGDMAEAQRLRDLHFQVNAPNTKTNVPLWTSSEEAFNSFDLSHFGETDSGFFGYGHYLTPIEKYAATYHPINRRFYVNMENPYIGSNDQYFNRIQYVKDKLAKRKGNIMRNLRDGKLTNFSKKLGINENTPLEEAEHLVDKYIKDETVKWNNKYIKYADEFEGKDGVLSWRELQGIPNKQEGIYKEVIVPKGEQIKSADAITYDDNGVRIPLGLRDNFRNKDIRYGLIPLSIGGKYIYNLNNNNK